MPISACEVQCLGVGSALLPSPIPSTTLRPGRARCHSDGAGRAQRDCQVLAVRATAPELIVAEELEDKRLAGLEQHASVVVYGLEPTTGGRRIHEPREHVQTVVVAVARRV